MAAKPKETAEETKEMERKNKLEGLEKVLNRVITNGFSSYFQVVDKEILQDYGVDLDFLNSKEAQLLMDKAGVESFQPFKDGKSITFKLVSDKVLNNRSAQNKAVVGSHTFYKPEWYDIFKGQLEKGQHAFIYGPTGCGKSTLCKIVAQELGRPFYRMNLNGETTVDNFLGTVRLKDKETYFISGMLPRAMEEGAILLLDEISAGQPEIHFVMHPALEDDPEIVLHEDGSRIVKAKPGFVVVGADNTKGTGDVSGNYGGTNPLNEAMRRRFKTFFDMSYSHKEKEILMHYTKDENLVNKVLGFAKEMRKAHAEGVIMTPTATPTLIDIVKLSSEWGIYKSFFYTMLTRIPDDDLDAVKTTAIKHNLLAHSGEKSEF